MASRSLIVATTMVVTLLLSFMLFTALPCSSTVNYVSRSLDKKKIPTLKAYNLLSRKGNGSKAGYNTVLTGKPVAGDEPQGFGQVYTFDMPLLGEKNINGTKLGKVRGTYTFVDQTGGSVIFVSESFVVENWYVPSLRSHLNGTFSAVGLEYIGLNSTKPIVGGTTDFVLASGIAITYPLPSDTGSIYDENGNLFLWFMYEFIFA